MDLSSKDRVSLDGYDRTNGWSGFGRHVAMSGDTIAVADNESYIDGLKGSVYIYRLDTSDNDTWKQEQRIVNTASTGNWYGDFLSLEGDTLVVPSLNENSNRGAVYIYDRICSSGTCSFELTQNFSGENAGDVFGAYASLSGNSLFISVRDVDIDGISNTGQVSYYTRTQAGGQWTLQQSFTPSNVVAEDRFGEIMAFDGTTLFVPTWRRVVDGVWGVGYGWIYELNQSTGEWEVTQELENPSGATGGIYYGAWKPSVRGDTLVIPSTAGIDVWKKIDGSWALQKVIPKSEGCHITAFHDDSLAVGCTATDGSKGAVYYLTCPDAFTAAAADGTYFTDSRITACIMFMLSSSAILSISN